MSFFEFSFAPICFSLMACCIFFKWGIKTSQIKYNIALIEGISLVNCFIYPYLHYETERQINTSENFILRSFIASSISIFTNLVIYFLHFRKSQ
jgi:hypothetical protein